MYINVSILCPRSCNSLKNIWCFRHLTLSQRVFLERSCFYLFCDPKHQCTSMAWNLPACLPCPEAEAPLVTTARARTRSCATTESSGELKAEVTHFAGASRHLQKAMTITSDSICSMIPKTPQICTARPPRCAGKHQLKCLRKTFHLPKKSVMCYAFFNYVHSTVRKPSGYQHLHTSSWALDSMGTCTRELGGLRSLNSYEAKLVAHAKCNCFISLFQQVFGVSQSWKTSSEGLGPRNDNPFRT